MTTTISSLAVDPVAATLRITEVLRHQVSALLKRRGLVVGMSGAVDSSAVSPDAAAEQSGVVPDDVKRSYCDIDQKRMTTRYLHLGPPLVEPVELTLSNGSR
jgi:NH3-dependent NAD+ synthetase